jgi:hypothetical protein
MHELGRRPHDLTPIPNHLFGIFAASATEIWACGQAGVMLNSNGDTVSAQCSHLKLGLVRREHARQHTTRHMPGAGGALRWCCKTGKYYHANLRL